MGTLASPRNFYFAFLKKGGIFNELRRRLLFGTYYTSSSAYYKTVLSQYTNFSNYSSLFKESLNLNTIHTNVDIQRGIMGKSTRSVIAHHGRPDFVFNDKKLSIFVYKWKLNGLKTRCEVHLYNGHVFLVNYFYNQLDKEERNYIVDTVTQKYISKYENEVDFQQSKISDRNNNLLMIDDFLMGLKITYLCSAESDWYEAMLGEMNNRKEKEDTRVRISERRFYNKI